MKVEENHQVHRSVEYREIGRHPRRPWSSTSGSTQDYPTFSNLQSLKLVVTVQPIFVVVVWTFLISLLISTSC